MTDDELIEAMKAAFESVADSGMWTWDAAMRAVLAVVRAHDSAELAALRAERDALRADAWQPIDTAPADTVVLLYTPELHFTNPERIEARIYRDSRGGSQHPWATKWMPIDKLLDAARRAGE